MFFQKCAGNDGSKHGRAAGGGYTALSVQTQRRVNNQVVAVVADYGGVLAMTSSATAGKGSQIPTQGHRSGAGVSADSLTPRKQSRMLASVSGLLGRVSAAPTAAETWRHGNITSLTSTI